MSRMQLQLRETDLSSIQSLRMAHWRSLPEPRELFLELKVRDSKGYLLKHGNVNYGYVCITGDHEISEFWLDKAGFPMAEEIFGQVIQNTEVNAVWCHSFDRLLLSLCLDKGWQSEIMGYLFRSRIPVRELPLQEGIEVRRGTPDDLDRILEKDDSYFESREEAEMVVSKERLLHFQHGEEFIGCGTVMHIFEDSGVYDIGMMVNPAHRGKGIGSSIVHYLAEYCQQRGWRPICGCAADNIASRRTLERAGFVTSDRMVLFRVG